MPRIICDFETASPAKLKECGAAVYAQHPCTEVLCLVWKTEWAPGFGVWTPWLPEYNDLSALAELARDPENIFVSHAMFEQWIWRYIMVPLGMPELPPERWQDTQATAFYKSCPGTLENLLRVMELPIEKDMEGNKLTLSLSAPMTKAEHERRYPGPTWGTMAEWRRRFVPGTYDRCRETMLRVIQYCMTDVAGEEEVLHAVGDLSPAERHVWILDQKINHRGVGVDMDFVYNAQMVVDRATIPMQQEFRDLTGGLEPGQRAEIMKWCAGQGVELENLQKGYLAELLGENEEGEDAGYESLADEEQGETRLPGASGALPETVRRVLQIRQMLGSSSIKKLARMRACVSFDGRARGIVQYHAAHPGRWGGRLLQPQNFPRGALRVDPEYAVAGILSGDPDYLVASIRGNAELAYWKETEPDKQASALEYLEAVRKMGPIEMVGSCLRHALVPAEGNVFEVGDFAGIEMRVDLALAGQYDKCELLATGKDVYLDMACDIYNVPKGTLTKADVEKRTIGKNTVLGCGFQMGGPKFHDRYCPKQPIEFAHQVVHSYRTQWAPKVVELWGALKWAVNQCIGTGQTIRVYGCTFRIDGDWMAIDLPSGWQTVWYYRPKMRPRTVGGEVRWQPSYKAMKSGKWITIFLYGGILCENIVQALARGLLCEAMGRLEYREQKPIVLSVHDEVVCEVPESRVDIKRFKETMKERSAWAESMGIPIEVDEWTGGRYKK